MWAEVYIIWILWNSTKRHKSCSCSLLSLSIKKTDLSYKSRKQRLYDAKHRAKQLELSIFSLTNWLCWISLGQWKRWWRGNCNRASSFPLSFGGCIYWNERTTLEVTACVWLALSVYACMHTCACICKCIIIIASPMTYLFLKFYASKLIISVSVYHIECQLQGK